MEMIERSCRNTAFYKSIGIQNEVKNSHENIYG